MVVQNSQLTGSSHWILTSLTFRGWQLAQRWRSESCKVGRHGEIQTLMDTLILQWVKEAAQISQMYPQMPTVEDSPILLPLFYQHWPKVKIQKICKQGKLRSYLDAKKKGTNGTCVLRMRWEEKSGHRCVNGRAWRSESWYPETTAADLTESTQSTKSRGFEDVCWKYQSQILPGFGRTWEDASMSIFEIRRSSQR